VRREGRGNKFRGAFAIGMAIIVMTSVGRSGGVPRYAPGYSDEDLLRSQRTAEIRHWK